MVSILPLKLDGVQVRRGGRRILGPVDLEIDRGGPLVLLGPNGAGKSTFLRVCHGIDRLSEGRANWAAPRAEANLRQVLVFQKPVLLRRSVLDNVAYPLTVRGVARRKARDEAAAMLATVGLDGFADRPAQVLSGGETQKMALARALVTKPEVLFLDEPTASLDGRSTREIETILAEVQRQGTKIVMATQILGQARRIASRVLFILNGQIHEEGDAKTFFENPETPEARGFLKGDIVE